MTEASEHRDADRLSGRLRLLSDTSRLLSPRLTRNPIKWWRYRRLTRQQLAYVAQAGAVSVVSVAEMRAANAELREANKRLRAIEQAIKNADKRGGKS